MTSLLDLSHDCSCPAEVSAGGLGWPSKSFPLPPDSTSVSCQTLRSVSLGQTAACWDMTLPLCCCRCTGALPRRSRGSVRTKGNKPRLVALLLRLLAGRASEDDWLPAACSSSAVSLHLCQSLTCESLLRIPFQRASLTPGTCMPKKRHGKSRPGPSLDPWVSSSNGGRLARVRVRVRGVFVFSWLN